MSKKKATLKEIKDKPIHKRTVDESIKFIREDPDGYWKESDEWDRNLDRDMKDLKKITDRWESTNKGDIMSKTKTVTIKPHITLCNPEDYFNDLIEDGVSVHDALVSIMEDELVHAELERDYPNYTVRDDGWDLDDNGLESVYTIRLIKMDDDDDELERELIASDKDMAHA